MNTGPIDPSGEPRGGKQRITSGTPCTLSWRAQEGPESKD